LTDKKHKLTIVIISAVVLVVVFSTVALASYIHTALLNTYIATSEEEFYFTSDMLSDEATVPTYQITHDWETEPYATISFELRNYENSLNISDRVIAYNVAAVPGESINGTLSPGGPNGETETINLDVPAPPDHQTSLEVMVTATATSPYSKTLQGRFIITPAITYSMEENAGEPVATLNIILAKSAELTRNVTIVWTEGAEPDMTNPIMTGATDDDLTSRTLAKSLNTAAVYELVFFKDSEENSYDDVTVTVAE